MSPPQAAFLLSALLLTALVSFGTYRSNRLLRELSALPFNPLLAPAENGLKFVLLALLLALEKLSGLPEERIGLVMPDGSDLLLGMAVGLAGWGISNMVTLAAIARWGRGIISALVIRAVIPRSRREWPAVALAMALAVGLEEVLFRSVLLGGLSTWLPPPLLVVITALLFGMLHSIQGSLGVAITTLLSIALSLLFLWRGSIWPPLVAHYVINIGQLVLAARRPDLLESSEF